MVNNTVGHRYDQRGAMLDFLNFASLVPSGQHCVPLSCSVFIFVEFRVNVALSLHNLKPFFFPG